MLQEQITTEVNLNDKNNPAYNVVAFFIPIVGAIIYLVNKDEYPVKAKGVGRATLWGFAYGAVYLIFKMVVSSHV